MSPGNCLRASGAGVAKIQLFLRTDMKLIFSFNCVHEGSVTTQAAAGQVMTTMRRGIHTHADK